VPVFLERRTGRLVVGGETFFILANTSARHRQTAALPAHAASPTAVPTTVLFRETGQQGNLVGEPCRGGSGSYNDGPFNTGLVING
jgi:hypothetical protein